MATIEVANLGFRSTQMPKISPLYSRVRRSHLRFHKSFESSGTRRIFLLRPLSCSLLDEQKKQRDVEVEVPFNEQENSLIEALIGIQGRGRSASPLQLQ
ncbi:hypothetical protein U1Q18_043510, partial [Sarracenia purpurea var. burkii]